MEFKVCNDCEIEKPVDQFFRHKRPTNPNALGAYCKECCSIHQKEYKSKKPKSPRVYTSKYTKEEALQKKREQRAAWKEKNKERVKEYNKNRMKFKKATDPVFKLKDTVRKRINEVLGQKKTRRTLEYVGCSLDELKRHLEQQFIIGMTWENHGVKGWHIDHIKPLASFDLTVEAQQNIAFHYTNLQPLWAQDNLEKSAKLDWKKESK